MSSTTERAESVGLLGKGPLPLPAAISIQPPSTGDDYDSDSSFQSEDENRPLTQQELRQRIMKGVSFLSKFIKSDCNLFLKIAAFHRELTKRSW